MIVLGVALGFTALDQDPAKVQVRIVDANDRGVGAVEAAQFWFFKDTDSRESAFTKAESWQGVRSDAEGRAELSAEKGRPVFAIDRKAKRGGYGVVQDAGDLSIKLVPLVHVFGTVAYEDLDHTVDDAMIYVRLNGTINFAQANTSLGKWSLLLPPGEYTVEISGRCHDAKEKRLTLTADKLEVDLKSTAVKPAPYESCFGKAPPPLVVSDARGCEKGVGWKDFHGKWVILEFWGFW